MKRIMLAALLAAMTMMLCSCGGSSYSGGKGYGGYDMPNSNDKSITDYIKRVDPDLWDSMESNWGK